MMRKQIEDIRRNTENMDLSQKIEYIRSYYWYHILLIGGGVLLAVFLVVHFAFPDPEPVFSCALINQPIDYQKDERIAEDFAAKAGLPKEQVVIDSNYNFSYGDVKYEDVNESSFEKLFLKWSNGQVDALLMNEDFLEYCLTVGGEFQGIGDYDTGELPVYEEHGVSGILISDGDAEGKLILMFPVEGSHREACQKFIDYIAEGERIG